ncbi:unannotated protein [freshwater metagenome]|uniref:Unannotated protein n=1 Tax=freshwater metagenome TaxID=449393 RepID=A0A6J6FQT7_9ZZZZ
MKREHRRKSNDLEFAQRAAGFGQSVLAVGPGDDEFGEQRVERSRDNVTCNNPGINSDTRTAGKAKGFDWPGGGAEVRPGIFTVNSELNRVAGDHRVRIIDESALRNSELFTNQVEAGDFFRHGVFNLKASIDLEEGDGAVGADQKFTGSRADVPDLFEDVLRCRIQQVALSISEERCWRFLDEFLVATLQRAVTG